MTGSRRHPGPATCTLRCTADSPPTYLVASSAAPERAPIFSWWVPAIGQFLRSDQWNMQTKKRTR